MRAVLCSIVLVMVVLAGLYAKVDATPRIECKVKFTKAGDIESIVVSSSGIGPEFVQKIQTPVVATNRNGCSYYSGPSPVIDDYSPTPPPQVDPNYRAPRRKLRVQVIETAQCPDLARR